MLREFRAILGYKRSHFKQTNIQAAINARCFTFFSYSISEVGNPKSSAIVFGLLLMYHEKDKTKAWQQMSCGFRLQSADLLPSGCFEQVNFHLSVFISLLICEIKVAILHPVCVSREEQGRPSFPAYIKHWERKYLPSWPCPWLQLPWEKAGDEQHPGSTVLSLSPSLCLQKETGLVNVCH